MYKMNKLLKLIIVILTITTVIITNNRIILWLLLFIMSFYNLKKNKKLLLLIDLVLVILLGLSKDNYTFLLLFKILFIINYLITVYYSLSFDEKKSLFVRKKSTKLMYYEDNFDRIINRINNNKNKYYEEYVSIDDKIEEDLERSYLQSRIRYYGYKSNKKKKNNVWNKIDTLILILSIVIFIIFFILR